MKANEFIIEGVAGPKNCWPGYRKTGTQPGTGKNKGKRVNDCEKIKEDDVEESGDEFEVRLDGQTVPGPYHDFDHARNKASKLISYQKGEVAEVYVNGKLKMKLKLNTPHQHFDELRQEFDMIENIIEQIADQHAVDADLVWEDLSTLTDDELYVFAVTSEPINEDWQKANKKDKTDGMSKKAVNAYRRENPGSKLKTAVTTKPSKLKRGSKASKRRSSYCSRSAGQQKMHNISCSKTPDKAICKARRRWNC
jgi:hypothetical protein